MRRKVSLIEERNRGRIRQIPIWHLQTYPLFAAHNNYHICANDDLQVFVCADFGCVSDAGRVSSTAYCRSELPSYPCNPHPETRADSQTRLFLVHNEDVVSA